MLYTIMNRIDFSASEWRLSINKNNYNLQSVLFSISLHHLNPPKRFIFIRNMFVTSITLFFIIWPLGNVGNIVPNHLCFALWITGAAAPTMFYCHLLPQWPAGLSAQPPDCSSYRMINARIRMDLSTSNGSSLMLLMRKLRPRGSVACSLVCSESAIMQTLISLASASFFLFSPNFIGI